MLWNALVGLINSRLVKLEATTFLNPFSSPLDIKGEGIAARTLVLGHPPLASPAPPSFHEGGNPVIETTHPIVFHIHNTFGSSHSAACFPYTSPHTSRSPIERDFAL